MIVKVYDNIRRKEVEVDITEAMYNRLFLTDLTLWEDNRITNAEINPGFFKEQESYFNWNRYVSLILNICRVRNQQQRKKKFVKEEHNDEGTIYEIVYNRKTQSLDIIEIYDMVDDNQFITFSNILYYDSPDNAAEILKLFCEELIWYFTVFKFKYYI